MEATGTDRWSDVQPLGAINGDLAQVLANVDTLRTAWEDSLDRASPEEFAEARRRSLRRHAIETGIIERLYDVDWGVTEALVLEGITAEVAAREGGLDEDALKTIRAQYDALEFLVDSVRGGRDLSVFFIRELHEAVCRTQATYEARNQFSQVVQTPLHHGQWKMQPNHVVRSDGSLLEYTPPEQVQPQVDRLVEFYASTEDSHPIARAAWLHHQFIRIHPFEDGNGRVARALTLLVLLKEKYAPLVVSRTQRDQYIDALDVANSGDLRNLIRLFARLEIVALRSELERPFETTIEGRGALEVAKAYAGRLKKLQEAATSEKATKTEILATALHRRITSYLNELASGVRDQFREADSDVRFSLVDSSPPDEKSRYWSAQIIRTAREVDFFTNLSRGSWWNRLHLYLLDETLRFVVVIQRAGHGETGVIVITAFAELVPHRSLDDDDRSFPSPLLRSSASDSVTLVFSDDAEERWTEVCEFVDEMFAAVVAEFAQQIGQ